MSSVERTLANPFARFVMLIQYSANVVALVIVYLATDYSAMGRNELGNVIQWAMLLRSTVIGSSIGSVRRGDWCRL